MNDEYIDLSVHELHTLFNQNKLEISFDKS